MSDPTTHHNGLTNEAVRDLIANRLRDHRVSNGFFSQNAAEFREMLVSNLKEATQALDSFDEGTALKRIADQFGWQSNEPEESDDWDSASYSRQTYRQFIGTEEEFDRIYNSAKHKQLADLEVEILREAGIEKPDSDYGCKECVCSCESPLILSANRDCVCPEGHQNGDEPLCCGSCGAIWYEYKESELWAMPGQRLVELAYPHGLRADIHELSLAHLMSESTRRELVNRVLNVQAEKIG